MLRHQRESKGHGTRGMLDDAVVVARFNFVTMLWIALASVGLMFILIFGFKVSVAWGVGIGLLVGAIGGYWKYSQLVNDR